MENDASLPGSRRAQLPTVPPHAAFPFQPCRDTITSHESPECTPSCPAGPLADIAITPEPPPASAQPSPAPRVPCPSPGTRGGAFGGCAPYPTPCGVFPGVLVAGECPPPPRLTSVCPSPCHPSDRPVCRAGTPAPKTGATPPSHPSEHWVGKAGPRRGRSKETDGRQGQTLYWSHAGGGDPQQASPLGWGRGVTGSGGGRVLGGGGSQAAARVVVQLRSSRLRRSKRYSPRPLGVPSGPPARRRRLVMWSPSALMAFTCSSR